MKDFDSFKYDSNWDDDSVIKFYENINNIQRKHLRVHKQDPKIRFKEDLLFLYNGKETQLDLQKIKKELLSDFSTVCNSSCQIRSLKNLRFVLCKSKDTMNLFAKIVKIKSQKDFVIIHFYLEKSQKKAQNYYQNTLPTTKFQNQAFMFPKEQIKEGHSLLSKDIVQESKQDIQKQELQIEKKHSIENKEKYLDDQIRRSGRMKCQKSVSNDFNYNFDTDEDYLKDDKKQTKNDQIIYHEAKQKDKLLTSDSKTESFEDSYDIDDEDYEIYIKKQNQAKKNHNSKSSSDDLQQNIKMQKINYELQQDSNAKYLDQQQYLNQQTHFEKQNNSPLPLFHQTFHKQTKDNKKIIVNQKRIMTSHTNSAQYQNTNNLDRSSSEIPLIHESIVKKIKQEQNPNSSYSSLNQNQVPFEYQQVSKDNLMQDNSLLKSQQQMQYMNKVQDKNQYTNQWFQDSIVKPLQMFYKQEMQSSQSLDAQSITYKQKILDQIKNKLNDILIDMEKLQNNQNQLEKNFQN